MAFSKNYSIERTDIGAMTGFPGGRGLQLNGFQVEIVRATKLTGDTSGSFDLEGVQRPNKIYVIPVTDSSGAVKTAIPAIAEVSFTHTDNDTVSVSGLGDWTKADFLVCGRSYKYA